MTTLVLLNCLGSAAVLPMLSAATMARLDSVGQKDQFGRFFVYRAIGWSTGSAAGGWLYQHGIRLNLNETMGMQSVHVELNGPVVVVLSGLVVFRGLQFALSLCLEFPTTVPPKSTDSNEVVIGRRASRDPGQLQQPGVRKDGTLSQLLCDRHVIIFLCSMAVNGVAGATYDNYVRQIFSSSFLSLFCQYHLITNLYCSRCTPPHEGNSVRQGELASRWPRTRIDDHRDWPSKLHNVEAAAVPHSATWSTILVGTSNGFDSPQNVAILDRSFSAGSGCSTASPRGVMGMHLVRCAKMVTKCMLYCNAWLVMLVGKCGTHAYLNLVTFGQAQQPSCMKWRQAIFGPPHRCVVQNSSVLNLDSL
eukprot:SAG31_NODE_989_length_10527_cov_14.905639_7_plen_362_part_00